MYFITYKQFIKNRHAIKEWYHNSPKVARHAFKKYIYGLWIDEDSKDRLWEYIHNDISNNCLKKHFRKVKTL